MHKDGRTHGDTTFKTFRLNDQVSSRLTGGQSQRPHGGIIRTYNGKENYKKETLPGFYGQTKILVVTSDKEDEH